MPQVISGDANRFIEQQLDVRAASLESVLKADVLAFSGGLLSGVDDIFHQVLEARRKASPLKLRLAVVLTTGGGYIEVVQRIVDTLRHHYSEVDFVVPNYAYSAGTVLAMSGDAIYMDYYSRLGPIDPQVENKSGRMVPALGYLAQYERLIKKANNGQITQAEVELLIDGFDQAELYQYEQAREMSITLLKEWLVKYKFKNWKKTEKRGKTVTASMRAGRATQIARELNKTQKWHVHGHGISMDVLRNKVNLLIDDFGDDSALNNAVRSYYELLDDYMAKRGHKGVFHLKGLYLPFM